MPLAILSDERLKTIDCKRAAPVTLVLFLGLLLGQGVHAAVASVGCPTATLDQIPRDWSEPLILLWKDDGGLDVLSCGQNHDTKAIRMLRWTTVYLPGIRTMDQNGGRRLVLDTRDGPIDLGDLASQPCLPQFGRKSRIECAVLFGEKKRKRSEPLTWSLSLSLGEDAGVATELLFYPPSRPIPLSE